MTTLWDTEELELWEEEQHRRDLARIYKTGKNYRCPRKEAITDYRNRRPRYHFPHASEPKQIRVFTNRVFRRKMRLNIHDERYYRIVPHDYRTYGWLYY